MDKFAIHHLKRIAKQVSTIEENLQNMKDDIFVLGGYFDGGFDNPNKKKNWNKEDETALCLLKKD